MNQATKLFWGEGLFLRPQHFQRQDAYHEARLHDLSRSLHPFGWGVRQLRVDEQSLTTGMFRPLRISAVFPDGELYSAPDADELPTGMAFDDLPPQTQEVTIYLALPLLKEYGGNCSAPRAGDASARYVQSDVRTPDAFSDAAEAEVSFLKKSARLLTDQQPRDAYVTVSLTRLRRNSTGVFEQDPGFMPPAVSLIACSQLLMQLRSLLDALQAKSQALVGMHRQPAQHIIEFRSGDIASFWLLHTVNTAFAALAHLHQHPGLPPERLHLELARLAGSLLTFSPAYELSDLPPYNHMNPAPGFRKLFDMIRELVDTVISARYFGIALEETRPSYHLGHLDSQRIDANSTLYVAVSGALAPAELIKIVPLRFKIGAPDDVDKAVLSALSCVTMSHQPQVPAAIPVRPGNSYFALDKHGPLYERMLKSQSIMIYAPSGIPELKLELMALTS